MRQKRLINSEFSEFISLLFFFYLITLFYLAYACSGASAAGAFAAGTSAADVSASGSFSSPRMYLSMASATCFAYAVACTTVFAPNTTSPAAKIPGCVVSPKLLVTRSPFAEAFRPSVVLTSLLFGPWLIEMITLSACT